MKTFGYSEPNVDFRKGYIEDLKMPGIEDNSIDVVISNCVINLSPDKYAVYSEIFRVLKPGGELYFSDVFANRRVPRELMDDPVQREIDQTEVSTNTFNCDTWNLCMNNLHHTLFHRITLLFLSVPGAQYTR
jgi:ubiquinone/menaquinone biosynthesis C-methylase UbiE